MKSGVRTVTDPTEETPQGLLERSATQAFRVVLAQQAFHRELSRSEQWWIKRGWKPATVSIDE